MEKTYSIKVKGIVQGVGFRPFVFRLAKERDLKGFVRNEGGNVAIEVQGEENECSSFLESLKTKKPPMAEIMGIEVYEMERRDFDDFSIDDSAQSEEDRFISPDIATCDDCLSELFKSKDRRYLYPFINCTNCGPRFTIIDSLPYDRERTTMKKFRMCGDCETEYKDPADRRFHAQPDACPVCGPQVELWQKERIATGNRAIELLIHALLEGKIVAIKGIGGFHLACDATNENAVREMRRKKGREEKPFALMSGSVERINAFCYVSEEEKSSLMSPRRPIVLLRKREDCGIVESVAPNNRYLGFMLPYTPIHHLIFHSIDKPLVMTSANLSEQPIMQTNDDVISSNLGDFSLVHNRDIRTRCDDSLIFVGPDGKEAMMRRARGYVPLPISARVKEGILACGGHMKNTFAITLRNEVILSQHIGDLDEALPFYEEEIEHFKNLFSMEPRIIAYDAHPEYLSTKYALVQEGQKIAVQHHHAHVCACMAEDGLDEALGVAFDGTGYGEDGNVWGGEFMVADYERFERIAHLKYVPLPGGDRAVMEPWRMKLVYLSEAFGGDAYGIPLVSDPERKKWDVISKAMKRGINSPLTSSAGRLFDAVSALLGVRDVINYEGQAAIELEMMASEEEKGSYEVSIRDGEISCTSLIEGIVNDLLRGEKKDRIAGKFHNSMAEMILDVCASQGMNDIVLSGGVFQNRLLLEKTFDLLSKNGYSVHMHHRVPTNDGGISLGQACIASRRLS
jgi:hydrogenase maturation protein HypF